MAENPVSSRPPAQDTIPIDEPEELPYQERMLLAHKAYIDGRGDPTILNAAQTFGVNYSTLYGRIHGSIPKAQASQAMQRLSPAEEEAIRDWILDLSRWGWPIRVERLRTMAKELLLDKGDTADLGIHWTDQFLHRHPQLKSKFVAALDKERSEAQDPENFAHWFNLYRTTIQEYDIKPENRHNMDEKGVMMGYIGKVRVIISKYDKIYMTQPGNRE